MVKKMTVYGVCGLCVGLMILSGCAGQTNTSEQKKVIAKSKCAVLHSSLAESYEGECFDGLAHGIGKAKGKDSYEGTFYEGQPHGKGIYTWSNGNRFDGEFINGVQADTGIMIFADGDRYEGEFINGQPSGQGVITYTNGNRYEGEWKDGFQHGNGIEFFTDGTQNSGIWINGKQECRVLAPDLSGNYEGGCLNGLAHGKGKSVGKDTYEGEFQKGLPDGRGVYIWANNEEYSGIWKNGKPDGKGVRTIDNAVRYAEEWKGGQRIQQERVFEIDESNYYIQLGLTSIEMWEAILKQRIAQKEKRKYIEEAEEEIKDLKNKEALYNRLLGGIKNEEIYSEETFDLFASLYLDEDEKDDDKTFQLYRLLDEVCYDFASGSYCAIGNELCGLFNETISRKNWIDDGCCIRNEKWTRNSSGHANRYLRTLYNAKYGQRILKGDLAQEYKWVKFCRGIDGSEKVCGFGLTVFPFPPAKGKLFDEYDLSKAFILKYGLNITLPYKETLVLHNHSKTKRYKIELGRTILGISFYDDALIEESEKVTELMRAGAIETLKRVLLEEEISKPDPLKDTEDLF